MPSNKKNVEFMTKLKTMVTKQAQAAPNPTATGKPGEDTKYVSVSESTEHVNKNEQGRPEKNPQDYDQKPSNDPSEPAKAKSAEETATEKAAAPAAVVSNGAPTAPVQAPNVTEQKVAEEVVVEEVVPADVSNQKIAELGEQLMKVIEAMQKQAEKPTATGKPGADTKYVSVSESTEHVNKNEQGRPEKNPQDYDQKPSKDPSEPAKAKKAEVELEAEKLATYKLAKDFTQYFFKNAAVTAQQQEKTAGRRDFEQMISIAAAELEQQTQEKAAAYEQEMEKAAEEQGAEAFNAWYKQAQYEQALQVAYNQEQLYTQKIAQLNAEKEAAEKRAALAEKEAAEKATELKEKQAAEKRANEMAAWADTIRAGVINDLRHELLNGNRS